MTRLIPLWVTIVASLMTLSVLAFSINLVVSPKTFFPDTDFLVKDKTFYEHVGYEAIFYWSSNCLFAF